MPSTISFEIATITYSVTHHKSPVIMFHQDKVLINSNLQSVTLWFNRLLPNLTLTYLFRATQNNHRSWKSSTVRKAFLNVQVTKLSKSFYLRWKILHLKLIRSLVSATKNKTWATPLASTFNSMCHHCITPSRKQTTKTNFCSLF